MTDIRTLFSQLSGRRYTYRDLRRQLSDIVAQSDIDIPAEIGIPDLLNTAQANKWIRKAGQNEYEIVIPDAEKAA